MNIKCPIVIFLFFQLSFGTCLAASFEAIKEPECKTWTYPNNVWTVGNQYLDPNNGVLQDSYSMLVRWQGSNFVNHVVNYDIGLFTGLHTTNQRGHQPESIHGSPGVQLDCYSAGLLINTWHTPHRPVVGGGYNTMWGYAWSERNRVRPFIKNGQATELVLQGNIAVPLYHPVRSPGSTSAIEGQVAFFAYLKDTSRGNEHLHPIAILALTHASNYNNSYNLNGHFHFDYNDLETQDYARRYPNWFPSSQTGNGVWFASGPVNTGTTNPFITVRYTGANVQTIVPILNPNAHLPFWRAHITQQNLINVVNRINNNTFHNGSKCIGPPNCPSIGYSTNPADYVLEYAGIITEIVLFDGKYDISEFNWILGDNSKDQLSIGVSIYGFGVYRYIP